MNMLTTCPMTPTGRGPSPMKMKRPALGGPCSGERERENSIMETVSARMGVLTGGSLWGLVGSDQFVLQWLRKSYSESNLRSQQWKRERRREGLSEGCRVEAEKGQSLGTNYQDRWGLGQIQCPCWGDERPKPCCLTLVALAGVLVRAA